MMKVDFNKLKNILKLKNCKTNKAIESSECLSEYMAVISNYIEYSHRLTQDQLSSMTMSLQDWILRREYTTCKVNIKLGDIFFADLGCNYKPEYSYPHPVVILEFVTNMILIIPVSTTESNINEAYHPVDNPDGSKNMRKVYGKEMEEKSDGFEQTSALLLYEARVISKGRLLRKEGEIKGNANGLLFKEIKDEVFKLCFPKKNIELYNINKKYNELLTQYNDMLLKYNSLIKLQKNIETKRD